MTLKRTNVRKLRISCEFLCLPYTAAFGDMNIRFRRRNIHRAAILLQRESRPRPGARRTSRSDLCFCARKHIRAVVSLHTFSDDQLLPPGNSRAARKRGGSPHRRVAAFRYGLPLCGSSLCAAPAQCIFPPARPHGRRWRGLRWASFGRAVRSPGPRRAGGRLIAATHLRHTPSFCRRGADTTWPAARRSISDGGSAPKSLLCVHRCFRRRDELGPARTRAPFERYMSCRFGFRAAVIVMRDSLAGGLQFGRINASSGVMTAGSRWAGCDRYTGGGPSHATRRNRHPCGIKSSPTSHAPSVASRSYSESRTPAITVMRGTHRRRRPSL